MTPLQKLADELEQSLRKNFGPGISLFITRDASIDVDDMIHACTEAIPHLQRYKKKRAEIEGKL